MSISSGLKTSPKVLKILVLGGYPMEFIMPFLDKVTKSSILSFNLGLQGGLLCLNGPRRLEPPHRHEKQAGRKNQGCHGKQVEAEVVQEEQYQHHQVTIKKNLHLGPFRFDANILGAHNSQKWFQGHECLGAIISGRNSSVKVMFPAQMLICHTRSSHFPFVL